MTSRLLSSRGASRRRMPILTFMRGSRVLGVHVVALLVGDHLEGELVVVAQEDAPLAAVGDLRGLGQDLGDRVALLAPHGHEHARHQREVEAHVALVAVAEVLDDVGGPLVGLGQEHPAGVGGVDLLAQALQVLVGLGQVLAVGAVALVEIGDGVEAEAVEADVEPEAHDVEHRLLDLFVLVVEVGLVGEEAVPVVLLALRVPGPVRPLGVDEDDPGLRPALVVVAPHVPVGLRVGAVLRDSWNHGCWSLVWFITRSATTLMPGRAPPRRGRRRRPGRRTPAGR